jgi:hypothetical protein
MSTLKVAALAAALVGGMTFTATAQPYGHWNGGYGHRQPQYRQAPVYIPPHIARKQAQLNQRFVEKFGYVQPQPRHNPYGGHGYGHRYPRHHQGAWGHNPYAW